MIPKSQKMKKTKILMVCLGNICRSPLAEGILASKLDPALFEVDSAGTGNWHVGNPPDKRSIAVGKAHDVHIDHLRGRQFTASDFKAFDRIYVMDSSNLSNVLALRETATSNAAVSMILEVLFPGENVDVPDPYYGGSIDFERVYDMLDQACTLIADELNTSTN